MFTGRVETSDQVLLVLCTFPDEERARQIGTVLVERQLAACVNLVPRMTAIYRWEGQTCEESEVLALLKTTTGCFDELREALEALHPYEVPEILALPVAGGSEGYLGWVTGAVRGQG